MKLLFLTTAIEHRTFRKTARMLSPYCERVTIVGFTRHNYPASDDDIDSTIWGQLEHGGYLKRLGLLLRSVVRVRKQLRDYDAVWCFPLDALLIAAIATLGTGKTIIYQAQDIRNVLIGNRPKNRLARAIEGLLLQRVSRLVVSSRAFFDHHFYPHYTFPRERMFVIENKLESDPPQSDDLREPALHNPQFTIGYFGVLRCQRSWEILVETVRYSEGNVNLFVRGKPGPIASFQTDVNNFAGITYGGPYKDPDELPDLYGPVHLVWAAYPYGYGNEGNWRWARTVRFYEACAFLRPVLVQAGTQDAKFVNKHNIGLVVDMSDVEAAVQQLLAITPEQIQKWKTNLQKLPRHMFIHTDEYKRLSETLKELSKDGSPK